MGMEQGVAAARVAMLSEDFLSLSGTRLAHRNTIHPCVCVMRTRVDEVLFGCCVRDAEPL